VQAVNWFLQFAYYTVHPDGGFFYTLYYLTFFVHNVLFVLPLYFGLTLLVGAQKKFDTLRSPTFEHNHGRYFLITTVAVTIWAGIFTVIVMFAHWFDVHNSNLFLYSFWFIDFASSVLTTIVSILLIVVTFLMWKYGHKLTNNCMKMKICLTFVMLL